MQPHEMLLKVLDSSWQEVKWYFDVYEYKISVKTQPFII